MDGYLIVIPYLPSGAQGRELEYAIAGWRRHFKENYHIAVVGEGLHPIKGSDVTCIESKRVDAIAGQYRQHLDYVSCFRKARKAFPDTDGFIFVADDVYAVNDFDIADVKLLKMLAPEYNCDPKTANKWRQDKLKTKRRLQAEGLTARNFTTHLPQWFDWDKWEAMVNKYDMAHSSYLIEDIYYNNYYQDRIPFWLNRDTDNFKWGVYDGNPKEEDLRRAFKTKIWITNCPEGWCATLEKLLKEHFGIN